MFKRKLQKFMKGNRTMTKNLKKTLSVILAIMMVVSAFPIISLAAETPTIISWPTIVEEYAEVGMLRGDLTLTGGEASVPGTFSIRLPSSAISTPSAGQSVPLTFTPDDTETYEVVNMKASEASKIPVKACSNPVLQGEINAKTIVTGAAIGTSELTLADDAVVMAYTKDITNRVDTITFDNPDKVYNEIGTYEEPVTIKFKTNNSGAYAVDLKATAKIKISDKIDAEIITAPTFDIAKDYIAKRGATVSELVLQGGVANTEGTFAVTNPEQKIIGGENIINVTFTPADLTKYNPVTVNVTATISIEAYIPEDLVIELPYSSTQKFDSIRIRNVGDKGVEPANATLYVTGVVDHPELNKTVAGVGEFKVYVTVYQSTKVVGENMILNIKIVPGTSTGTFLSCGATRTLQDDGSYILNISHGSNHEAPVLNGTTKVKVNGEAIAEYPVSKETVKTQYHATKTGHYEIVIEYVPAENDYLTFSKNEYTCPTKFDLVVTMPRSVEIIENCKIFSITNPTSDGRAIPGESVSILRDVLDSNRRFDGWVFYDDEGNEFIPEGLPEDYMTEQLISFIMPDHDVKVKAIITTVIGGGNDDDEPGTDEPGIELPDIDIDLGDLTEGPHKLKIVNIILNLVEMIKEFIRTIGEFFGSINIKDLGGIIG